MRQVFHLFTALLLVVAIDCGGADGGANDHHTSVSSAKEASPRPPPASRLVLWCDGQGLAGYANNDPVKRWADKSGNQHHLETSSSATTPRLIETDGEKAVQFLGGEKAVDGAADLFQLPLTGEERGATVFVVGRNLLNAPWLATAPSRTGSLRMLGGFAQHTGNKAPLVRPFGNERDDVVHLCILRAEVGEDLILRVSAWRDGELTTEAADEDPSDGVLFQNGQLGVVVPGWNGSFSIREVLIYEGLMSDEDFEMTRNYLLARHNLAEGPDAPEHPAAYQASGATAAEARTIPNTQPVTESLRLWFAADNIQDVADGGPVTAWPNKVDGAPDAQAERSHAPRLDKKGMAAWPIVVSTADKAERHAEYLTIPMNETWDEITVLVAGTTLVRPGVFTTAPGRVGALRHFGWLQFSGTDLAFNNPFNLLRELQQEADLIAVVIRREQTGDLVLRSYAHGVLQKEARVPANATETDGILLLNPHIGGTSGLFAFGGGIAEIMFYARALTDTERQQTEQYLAQKYHMPLAENASAAVAEAKKTWADRLPQIPAENSWLGNSFSGRDDVWVQSGIFDIAALPDGTVVAISVWDERHRELGFYRDGSVIGERISEPGTAIARSGQYLYVGGTVLKQPWVAIQRLNLDGTVAPWPEFGDDGVRIKTERPWQHVSGIAVDTERIYLTIEDRSAIYVHDIGTGQRIAEFKTDAAPGPLAVDGSGQLWAGIGDRVVELDTAGQPTGRELAFTAGALTVDPTGLLVVADRGERHQVIFVDTAKAKPVEIKTVGALGGIYTADPPGLLAPDRIVRPKGVAVDAAGNVSVVGAGILRNFSPDGQLRWQLYCTEFTSCGDFEPTSNTELIYTGRHVYKHMPDQPPGRDWQLHAYIGSRAEGFRDKTAILRRWGDRLAHYTTVDPLFILSGRDADGFSMQPSGLFFYQNAPRDDRPPHAPEEENFFWVDRNGDGEFQSEEFSVNTNARWRGKSFHISVDTDGGVWVPLRRNGLRYVPRRGFTDAGAPDYDLGDMQELPLPPDFVSAERICYFPETDTMYVSGDTWDHLEIGGESWGNAGREVVKYEDWNDPRKRRIACRIPYPKEALDIRSVVVLPEINLLLAGEMKTMAILVYDTDTGRLLGVIQADTDVVGGIGWLDINDGISAAVRRTDTGDELVIQIEEVYSEKIIVYRIPLADIDQRRRNGKRNL